MDLNVKNKRIMGVDYGDVRTGLALSDISGSLSSAYCTIKEGGMRKTAIRVSEEAKKNGASLIVVGLPKNMDGTEGERAKLCREFADELAARSSLEVTMWDERRTTVEAHNILSQHNYHGKRRKNTVDAVAASLILEGYLAFRGR